MVQRRYAELTAAECEAFEAACARHGFSREDFDIVANVPAGDDRAVRDSDGGARAITVQRVIGTEIEIYRAAGDARWIEAFERDLQRDAFGFPLAD